MRHMDHTPELTLGWAYRPAHMAGEVRIVLPTLAVVLPRLALPMRQGISSTQILQQGSARNEQHQPLYLAGQHRGLHLY